MATLQDRLNILYEELRDRNYKHGRKDFAKHCGITRGKLNGYLNGNGEKLWESLRTIARNNHVSVSWLLGETDDRLESDVHLKNLIKGLNEEDMKLIRGLAEYLKAKSKTDKE